MRARLDMLKANVAVAPVAVPDAPAVITRSDVDRPSGIAMLISPGRAPARAYICNRLAHAIDVFDPDARLLLSFGSLGTLPGSFNDPADVLVIPFEPCLAGLTNEPALVAVADRENHRVQIFEPDGRLRAILGWTRPLSRFGRPLSRSTLEIEIDNLALPSRLEWSSPWLEITTYGQRVVRVDLGRVCRASADAAARRLARRSRRPVRGWTTPPAGPVDRPRPAMIAKGA
jgi:hypothetical protein